MLVRDLLLTENFKNLFSVNDKEKWAEQAFAQLQATYGPIGGLHGNGFSSIGDFKKNIPFWKLSVKGDKIIAAAFYKDKAGRKCVAVCQDGSKEGKSALASIMSADLKHGRSYIEVSGGALGFLVKLHGYEELKKYAVPVSILGKEMGDDLRPVPASDPDLKKHPELKDYFYQRQISGELHTKIALGQTGKKLF